MKIAIHQPNYIPYPGFFAKVNLSDVFVIYDTAQFTRGDFINRNRIRNFSFNGYRWLTLPIVGGYDRDFQGVAINQVEIVDDEIFRSHSDTLKNMYSKAPFFDKEICEVLQTPHKNLAEHNTFMIKYLLNKLGVVRTRVMMASALGITIRHSTQGIIDIVRALGGDEYISGTGAKAYLDEESFGKESIILSFLDFKPLEYPQIHPGFVENMSIIDAIFNIGWDNTFLKMKEAKTRLADGYGKIAQN